jgi:poly-gamma-glutamate synthesis protein (capsule biosynthesis protein)
LANAELDLIAAGDIILGPDCGYLFDSTRQLLRDADLAVGQLEVTHTERSAHAVSLGRVPANLRPLADAGFDLVTLAGNHLADYGPEGIEDTHEWLDRHGIAHVGAGMNLEEARKACVLERRGIRVGFLNYNCVGPKETWAGANTPGNAYVNVITHYELDHANPGGQPKAYTFAEPVSMGRLKEDIRRLRSECDALIVALHKGLVHTPAKLLDYEFQVAYEAIDAGADLILAHHSHILKGIEWYKGKAIFHSLGNGYVYLPLQALVTGPLPDNWAQRRKAMFGFEPDPEYVTYPFHPEAKFTMLARCRVGAAGVTRVAFLPCFVNRRGQPELLTRTGGGEEMLDYMRRITREAGLNAEFSWDGDEVVVTCGNG